MERAPLVMAPRNVRRSMTYSVTPLTQILRDEIVQQGPIPFSRFMELALYHPVHGYYRRTVDPFGVHGDFYTAEQVQPVFGRLIAAYFQQLSPAPARTLVELGAGRREMAPHFSAFDYVAVDVGLGEMPERFSGFVFANEFLDALPVDVVVRRNGELRELRVGIDSGRFSWCECGGASEEARAFVADSVGALAEGARAEVCLPALDWIRRIADALESGYALFIDYGYTRRESIRFPEGTLMTYRRHQASASVLEDPGICDITAHVAFSAVESEAQRCGFTVLRFENLASALLRAGEPDQFAAALASPGEQESLRLRMQLKTLLFGMGETFRSLLLQKK